MGVAAPLHFYDGFHAVLTRKRRINGSFCTVLSSVLVASFSSRRTSSVRSPVIGRLPETVKYLTGSPWPLGMGLWSGLTVYFKKEFEAFVFLDGFPEAVSSVYIRVLARLSVLPGHGRLELSKRS